ncbi:uncharacterized protein LOC110442310 [Mizuhopecten yessoensis]|uniref:uncharacterized protein LOC110442310 n=1 Tax=Mizuhopecten yessoensis TaxID=6573 RepID=UPI000B45A764|nr:uncharacterized protein LOC110442310 [Mizuhopecten yessoensis]
MNIDKDGSSTEPTCTRQDSTVNLSTADALSLFSSRLDIALSSHRSLISSDIDKKLQSQEKLLAANKSDFKFKFEGNRKQFVFNSEIRLDISKAIQAIKDDNSELAESTLTICLAHLDERNKIVKIADRHGWDTVAEYEDDPICDDADDSSKLRQAEARAQRKRKAKSASRNTNKPYERPGLGRGSGGNTGNVDLFRGFQSTGEMGEFPFYAQRGAVNGSMPGAPGGFHPSSAGPVNKQNSTCFYCYGAGHWASNCPRRVRTTPTHTQSVPAIKQ